jgi:hypothetical protein
MGSGSGPPGGGGTPPEDYGPTMGRAAVLANVGPQTVTTPGGGITFTSAPDLQTKINANAANSIFVPSLGWSDWSQRIVCSGKHPRIFIPGAPGTRVFDCGGRDLTNIIGGSNGTHHFELYGGTWQNVGTTYPPATGAGNGFSADDGSIIRDVIVRDCVAAGVAISGDNVTLERFRVNDNGQDGVKNASGGGNALVRRGEYFNNGYIDPDATPGDHGGAGKWSGGAPVNGTIEECYVHEPFDYGLWNDFAGFWTVRNNVIEDCRKNGVFCERMVAGGVVEHNWFARNGEEGPINGINANNTCVSGCETPVGAEVLYEWNHIEGAHILFAVNNNVGAGTVNKRVRIVNNRLKLTDNVGTSFVFWGQDTNAAPKPLFTEATITINNNLIQTAGFAAASHFRWPTSTSSVITLSKAGWQALGFDTTSTFEQV